MTRHLDPDRRRPAPPHPGFENVVLNIDDELRMCLRCHAAIPDRENDKLNHADIDQLIALRFIQLLERVAILETAVGLLDAVTVKQSNPGSSAIPSVVTDTEGSPGLDQTSEAGSAPHDASIPASDPNVPTPEQEATAGRSGVADSHDSTEARADVPHGAGPPPAAYFPPAAGGTNRGSRPAGPEAPSGRLHLVGTELPDPRRFPQ